MSRSYEARNPGFREFVAEVFGRARFVTDLGIRLVDVGPGWCETELAIEPRHLQQNGFVHAGVEATMADHTAGGAAVSLIAAGEYILTIEFKLNLLRPAGGDQLRCRAEVLRPGRTFSVVESEVFAGSDLVAKATVTLAVLQGNL